MRVRSKISELAAVIHEKKTHTKFEKMKNYKEEKVQIKKSLVAKPAPSLEINVIGMTVHEAIPDVEAFIDSAVISNLEEVRIVHGMGTGKLRAGIHEYLRTNRNVAEFRLGKYGEGETGVTIVKIK
jgi:DNA mismatch repair protein MutS2